MTSRCPTKPPQQGFGLIELLVALVLATVLIAGAVTVYVQSRNTFRASEEVARLQETARYAMSFLETDLRMANYWGLNNRAAYIVNRAGQPGEPTDSWVDDLCGDGWPIDMDRFVQAYDDSKPNCVDGTVDDSDVLVVRRVSETPETVALTASALYLQTSRLQGTLFVADPACTPNRADCIPSGYLPPQSQSSAVIVNAYYVGINAEGAPALRRQRLIAGPDIRDEEIIPGVEDLQVELGVDNDDDTTVDYFVAPDVAPVGATIVAVRIWLRVRSVQPDFTFIDDRTYTYSNTDFTPRATDNENRFRRMLISKTIQLRNTRV